jgi:Electron transfer DM13
VVYAGAVLARLFRSPLVWGVAFVLANAIGVGLYWFQPWRLVTSTEVQDTLPPVSAPKSTASAAVTESPASGNRVLAAGTFISHEHETSGSAQVVELADGSRRLVLRELNTSDGPDLRVWLTDQEVKPGIAGWKVFDDGRWVEVAALKGNRGNQVYPLPADLDLADLRSVAIWCKRFSVSFGAAPLAPA